jgi:hypothetical protein
VIGQNVFIAFLTIAAGDKFTLFIVLIPPPEGGGEGLGGGSGHSPLPLLLKGVLGHVSC